MRIGVVSDTHNNLLNVKKIVMLFNEANVEHVIHTGDISQPKTLEVFRDLTIPMSGVYGNNDEREVLEAAAVEFGFQLLEPPMSLQWAGRDIVVVHDPLELEAVDCTAYDVILHGHTHRQTIEYEDGRLTFNPGECAGHMVGYNAIGVLDLVTLETEILNF